MTIPPQENCIYIQHPSTKAILSNNVFIHQFGVDFTLDRMNQRRTARASILERRRIKRGAKEAEVAREHEREQARARRELAKRHILVNPENLRPTNSYGTPEFVKRGYYVDIPFNCKSCGAAQVWTETQQKWWYEAAKGDVWTVAVLCRPCRKREQARRAAAREVHLGGLAAKKKHAV